MGWFDDNHWAGEAYDFGMGYMARAGFRPEAGLSDIDDSDLDSFDGSDGLDGFGDFGGFGFGAGICCAGRTKAGKRCRVTSDSLHGAGRTIPQHGYCTQHLRQSPQGTALSRAPKPSGRQEPDPALVSAARSGNLMEVRGLLCVGPANDVVLHDKKVDLEVVGMGGDTAVAAAAREGHHDVLLELLCAGANPKAIALVQAKLQEVQEKIQDGLHRLAAKSTLELRERLRVSKVLLEAAHQDWPVPELPPIPPEPKLPEASSLSVVQLKDVLRKHGAKLSGRKNELIERVMEKDLMASDRREKLQGHQRERDAAMCKRAALQLDLDTRASRLKNIASESAPRTPSDTEVQNVVRKELAVQTPFGRRNLHRDALTSFEAADKFAGSRIGFIFKLGPQGLGYYSDERADADGARHASDRSRSPRRAIDVARPICKYHSQGRCHFGLRCSFRHERRPEAAPAKSGLRPLCCYLLQGKCRFGYDCDFSHENPSERRACHFGSSCWFGHH